VAAAHLHVELQLLEVFVVVGEHVDEADLLARLAAGLLGGRRGCARARLRGRGKRVAAGHVGDACHVHRVHRVHRSSDNEASGTLWKSTERTEIVVELSISPRFLI